MLQTDYTTNVPHSADMVELQSRLKPPSQIRGRVDDWHAYVCTLTVL